MCQLLPINRAARRKRLWPDKWGVVFRLVTVAFAVLFGAAGCSSGSDEVVADTSNLTAIPTVEPTAEPPEPTPTTAPISETDANIEPAVESEPESGTVDIDTYLDQLGADGFSGVVAVQTADTEIIRAFGLADREQEIPVTEDTVFSTGSITKQFTGAAILRLEMDGLLSVDDTLGDHIPDLPADYAALTLHQLLTHSTGLPGGIGDDWDPVDRDAMIELVAETPLQFEPGTAFGYSNPGYSLLGIVIELVTGQTYEEYLAEALFAPAGMADTGYILPTWDREAVAVGYDGSEPFGRPNELPWGDDGPYWHLRANGGVMSTAPDMLAWHEALLGNKILDPESKAKLYGRHIEEGEGGGTFYGYGWASFPSAEDGWVIAHNGGNGVWFADFWRFLDEGLTVFIATNDAQNTSEGVAIEIAEAAAGGPVVADGFGTPPSFEETLADISSLPQIDEIPDSGAGQAAGALLDLLTGDADPDFNQFIEDRAPLYVVATLPDEERAEIIAELRGDRERFAAATVAAIHQRDQSTVHILLDVDGNTEIVTVVGSDDGRILEFGIDN